MNLRQPYEQLIADKLRQLRPPDADASWQQMKRLLDDDEDKGGGGRKRPPGGSGWWRIGILAIVLSASFWLYVDKTPASGTSLSKNNPAISPQAATHPATTNKANNSAKNQTAIIDNTTTLTVQNTANTSANNTAGGIDGKSITAATKNSATGTVTQTIPAASTDADDASALPGNNKLEKENAIKSQKNNIIKRSGSNGGTNNSKNIHSTPDYVAVVLPLNEKNNRIKQHAAGSGITDNTGASLNSANHLNTEYAAYGSKNKTRPGKVSNHNTIVDGTAFDDSNTSNTGNNFGPAVSAASNKEKEWIEKLTGLKITTGIPSYNTSLAAGDSIAKGRDGNSMLNNETKKAVAKAQRDNEIALLDKKDKKSVHLNLSNVFKPFSLHMDAEPWWAAGLAVNANITVHAQNRYNYNMNAKSGAALLGDYIPSPYLQFHLNNYVYLQTELNFVSPQFTPQLLAYRQSSDISATQAGMSQEKSIYIQKMYYFNWPVSLHYSPINNLFLSAGVQFASFQSGIASIQEKQYVTASGPDHATSVFTDVLKFKDDSIAAKIAPNEWRWQVGAEYYIDRFSIGLRYNQSFKNAVNAVASPSLPPTVYRNESLLFFIRYNLFESRSKNTVPKNQ